MKSKALRAFVLVIAVLAVPTLVTLPADGILNELARLLPLVVLAGLAGAVPVRLPGRHIDMAPIDTFILVGLVALGPLAAALTCIAGVVGAAMGSRRRPAALRFVFNLGAMVLSVAAASWAFVSMSGNLAESIVAVIGPLAVATGVYSLVNTGLLAAAIALEKRRAFLVTWKRSLLCMAWSYLASFSAAVAVLAMFDADILWALVLAVLTCCLVVTFYRAQAGQARYSSPVS